ncbi:MAG: hypothetical protein H0X44_05550, partial [Acidobacteria bacterium]|nr:hypothetical protein [Acidobacteriota bacterium]
LEVCFFLGREVEAPQIRSAAPSSRSKVYHLVRIVHRDEVEAPLTDWLREAYEVSDSLSGQAARPARTAKPAKPARKRPPRRQKKR